MSSPFDVGRIADEVMAALNSRTQIAPFSNRHAFEIADAYRVTPQLRRLREAKGERALGRKIGFTNRTIWAEYGVDRPIWGYVYDRTVSDLRMVDAGVVLAHFNEPQIEPEIIFQLSAAPDSDMDERDLLSCIAWVSHGFEIVHSIYPQWKFAVADTIAAGGLHGALLIGERHVIEGDSQAWFDHLRNIEIVMACGETVASGCAGNMLGGPLSALRHLVRILGDDAHNPSLAAGEIVSTGTLTRALPIKPGQTWTTTLNDVPLQGTTIRFC